MQDARSVADLFSRRVASTPDSPALRFRAEGRWQHYTWQEWWERSRDIAAGLAELGFCPGERVALYGSTSPEWLLCDMAVQMTGGVTCAFPGTDRVEQLADRLRIASCRIMIVEDVDLLARLAAVGDAMSSVDRIVVMRPQAPSRKTSGYDGAAVMNTEDALDGPLANMRARVVRLDELQMLGREALDRGSVTPMEELAIEVRPEWPSTVVFAVSFDEQPRAVVATHANHLAAVLGLAQALLVERNDVQLLTLPVGHIRGIVDYRFSIVTGATITVWQGPHKLAETLQAVQPTFLSTTPKLCEKVYARLLSESREGGGIEQAMFQWAVSVGREMLYLRQSGELPGRMLSMKFKAAEQLVFRRVRAIFGGRIRFLLVSGAPLSPEVSELLTVAGILVLEGYGVSATTGVSHVNRSFGFRHGTVGTPLAGVEVRVDSDGEVFVRGPNVSPGHLEGDAIVPCAVEEGWLRTGDLGRIDDDGFLALKGRQGAVITLADGERVSPEHIERRLRSGALVSQAFVYGDSRAFLTALITLDEERLKEFAADEGLPTDDPERLCRHPVVYSAIDDVVGEQNSSLAAHEEVKKFAILDQEFTPEGGELSPMRKLRRRFIENQYGTLFESFYRETY